MQLVNEPKMLKETRRYSEAGKELDSFRLKLQECNAANFREFKEFFPSADRVGDKTFEVCINVRGNMYRLIVENYYDSRETYFVEFLSHKD